jgi:Mn-dependent DtxR family transcriptional regulator
MRRRHRLAWVFLLFVESLIAALAEELAALIAYFIRKWRKRKKRK